MCKKIWREHESLILLANVSLNPEILLSSMLFYAVPLSITSPLCSFCTCSAFILYMYHSIFDWIGLDDLYRSFPAQTILWYFYPLCLYLLQKFKNLIHGATLVLHDHAKLTQTCFRMLAVYLYMPVCFSFCFCGGFCVCIYILF